jgi:hypothetical protein
LVQVVDDDDCFPRADSASPSGKVEDTQPESDERQKHRSGPLARCRLAPVAQARSAPGSDEINAGAIELLDATGSHSDLDAKQVLGSAAHRGIGQDSRLDSRGIGCGWFSLRKNLAIW